MLSRAWEILSGTRLASDTRSIEYLGTEKGGGVRSAGVTGTVTGLRCKYLVVDDPVTGHQQASNRIQMNKNWDWYKSDARTRMIPSGSEIIVGTRWSSADLIGKVLELRDLGLEAWEYLRIPLLADSPDDPLGREIGERLWPDWYTESHVEDARRDPRNFRTLQQQRPIDEANTWLPMECLKTMDRHAIPSTLKYFLGCDLALSISKGDFTVFAVIAVDTKRKAYLVDMYRQQQSPDVTCDVLLNLCARYKPVSVLMDDDNAAKVFERMVFTAAQRVGVPVPLRLVGTQRRDKEVRAAPLRGLFLDGTFHISDEIWSATVIEELSAFPAATKHDDIVDALAVVASEWVKIAPPKQKLKKVFDPVKTAYHYGKGPQSSDIVTQSHLDELWKDNESQEKYQLSKMRI
jgi:predicted phage terminase large subunit-like protein